MRAVNDYHLGIDWIVHESGQSDTFVHLQTGLILWLLAAIVVGRRLGTAVPLGLVVLAEIGNEIMNRLYSGRWNWPDTIGDAIATWAWPVVLTIVLAIDRQQRDAAGKRADIDRQADVFEPDERPPLRSVGRR